MDVFERAVIKPRPAVAPAGGGAEIRLHGERYRVLVVPPVEAIPYGTLAKAKEFFDNGGLVVGDRFLPSKSATIGKASSDVGKLCRGIWGREAKPTLGGFQGNAKEGEAWLLPQRLTPGEIFRSQAFGGDSLTFIDELGEAEQWLHVLHRRKDGRDIFLVTNQNHQGTARKFIFLATGRGEPELWDPMRNEITALSFHRVGDATVECALTLEPLETVLLVFQPEKIARPLRIEPDTKSIRESIAMVRDPNPPVEPPTPDLKRRPLTLSPVKAADPFRGRVTIPADVDLTTCRVYLQMDDLPDNSAAVTVNGIKVGGVIGRPTRLEIAQYLKPGENRVLIEPLPPKAARLVFYLR